MKLRGNSFGEAACLLQRVKRRNKDKTEGVDVLSSLYITLCEILQGYIPIEDFMEMEVPTVSSIYESAKYMGEMRKREMDEKRGSYNPKGMNNIPGRMRR